jgi:hypothetical protein
MSEILNSPFKKPECGDMFNLGGYSTTISQLKDVLGGLINLQVVGTDPDYVGPIDGAALVADYVPAAGNVNPDSTFFIIPETDAAVYIVVLADGTQFTITAVQSTANLGKEIPYRLLRVVAHGTTGYFSVVY